MLSPYIIVKDVKLEYFPDFLPKNDKRKKIELNAPIGGIPNQTVKKRIFNNPRIYDFTVMCKRGRWRRWRPRSLDLFERRWYIRLKVCQRIFWTSVRFASLRETFLVSINVTYQSSVMVSHVRRDRYIIFRERVMWGMVSPIFQF